MRKPGSRKKYNFFALWQGIRHAMYDLKKYGEKRNIRVRMDRILGFRGRHGDTLDDIVL